MDSAQTGNIPTTDEYKDIKERSSENLDRSVNNKVSVDDHQHGNSKSIAHNALL